MKKVSLWSLLIFINCIITVLFNSYPACANSDSQKEPLYEQLIRAVVRLEEHQSICTPGLDWAIERDVQVGSAFFLHDRYKGKSRFFIVTARHAVENRADLFTRVQITRGSENYAILYLPRKLWVFHPAPTKRDYLPIDVAVMLIPQTKFIKNFLCCEIPEDCGINENTNKQRENQLKVSPDVMERAIFFGFPGGDVSKKSFEPFARAGVVAYTAYNPDFRINGKLVSDNSIYYIDAPSFPGNSGGPVMREPLPLKRDVRLRGLVTGGNRIGRDYTIVTRPEKILETIQYARKVAKLNKNGWIKSIPKLPIECKPDNKK